MEDIFSPIQIVVDVLFNGYSVCSVSTFLEYNIAEVLSFKMGGLVSMNNICELFHVLRAQYICVPPVKRCSTTLQFQYTSVVPLEKVCCERNSE